MTEEAIERVTERLFPQLTPGDLACLAELGEEVRAAAGEVLFEEGQPLTHLFAVLDGEVRVSRQANGQEVLLVRHRAGNFSGDLSLLTGAPAAATGRAVTDARLVRLSAGGLRRLVAECPALACTVLTSLSTRSREGDALVLQREKLASLGRMAAGLAHEINNPAAAAHRAAGLIGERLARLPALTARLAAAGLTPDQYAGLDAFLADARVRSAGPPLDPLARSDKEEALAAWLDGHGVADAWSVAPALLDAGVDRPAAEALAGTLPPDAVPAVAAWATAALDMAALARTAEEACGRISGLVQSVKAYSYMDTDAVRELDVHAGLESTLKILDHKLRANGVRVVREYDRELPRVLAHGGELNQVWTNLIDNAADAMAGGGTLTVRTARADGGVLVEVCDTGPGVPPEARGRLFEPFFTTKPPGSGTGLGLDVVRRLVLRHRGDVRLAGSPGDTRFQVRLPAL